MVEIFFLIISPEGLCVMLRSSFPESKLFFWKSRNEPLERAGRLSLSLSLQPALSPFFSFTLALALLWPRATRENVAQIQTNFEQLRKYLWARNDKGLSNVTGETTVAGAVSATTIKMFSVNFLRLPCLWSPPSVQQRVYCSFTVRVRRRLRCLGCSVSTALLSAAGFRLSGLWPSSRWLWEQWDFTTATFSFSKFKILLSRFSYLKIKIISL